ncbi:bifunctional pyr operon transcriptional regulator/uracil phosphoribosyltransferase PyrR [Candidatus Aerophobetes bacterium]|uniref:Bifunctional protein PyrR n=1 Tax=Aerophobetes bacterium TaxID=2030807 RepID=A0A7V5I0T1_UNCAE|nr:bifunctional pyr operon transcriptional regulator/uracil phosphoribosyltransferase PyrR [Candidatus Aerophobetes bacterium]HHF98362.1 bifunctional pyr operon transcriptional regulator/uracil phosphoribosyltransferase PyrR [Candidatus Aerophobetes bacterium]
MGNFMKIMNEGEIERILRSLCQRILRKKENLDNLVIVGIQRRGAILARRISGLIEDLKGQKIPVGSLDINLYRDDLSRISYQPVIRDTDIPFPVDDKYILLVDDVLYTGRTVRAALDALLDLGRPRKIELLVLVDRNCRELPIQADYVGKKIVVSPEKLVEVRLRELDKKEEVVIFQREKDEI